MFEYKKSKLGGWNKYTFKHAKKKTGFSIVPDRGALLLDITFEGRQILDGYIDGEELKDLKWSKSSILFPFANRLKDGKYIWMNKEYSFPINHIASNNAIHGMVRESVFKVEEVRMNTTLAEIKCRYEYHGDNPSYPFPYTLDLTFGINTNNRFWVAFDVLNRCDHEIPVSFGWHPYFKLGPNADQTKLMLPTCQQVGIDSRMLPTGILKPFNAWQRATPIGQADFDNCFFVTDTKSTYRLSLQSEKQKLTMVGSATSFPYFQVFTPPHRESVAIEPMTGNVDVLNNKNGLKVLEPGGIWKERFYLEWKKA
jgi:aldose 1-epimerase